MYRKVQNYDMWETLMFFSSYSQNLILKNFKVLHLSKNLKSEYQSKFSPIKFLHYTVACKYY